MRRIRATHLFVFAALLVLGVVARFLPHAPNFTPIAACALFAGFFFRRAAWALLLPLAALLISDAMLGWYDFRVMLVVYGAMMLPVTLRGFLKSRVGVVRVGLCSLAMSSFFFLSSNLAVWAFSGVYAKTLVGLEQCFVAAVPFFRFTVLGDLCWSGVIFGAYVLCEAGMAHRSWARLPVARSA